MRYVIVDLETTGLALDRAWPLEVAAIILDDALKYVGEFSRVLLDAKYAELPGDVFEPGAMKLHRDTGLSDEINRDQGTSIQIATGELIEFMARNGVDVEARGRTIMIGNNPAFDRAFLRRFFPTVETCFHYRMIDVSTLREVAALASGLGTERLKSAMAQGQTGTKHRALGDCRSCARELTTYAACFDGGKLLETLKAQGAIG